MRVWGAAGIVLALAGCADNPPSRSYLAMNSMLEATKMRTQYRAELEGAEFAPIRGRVDLAESFEGGVPACDEASLDGYPAADQQRSLRRWMELRTAYLIGLDALQVKAGESSRVTAPAAWRYSVALAEARRQSTQLIADLADGKMTFCQFAQADKSLPYVAARRAQPLGPDMNAVLLAVEPAQRYPTPALAPGAPQANSRATAVIQPQTINPSNANQR